MPCSGKELEKEFRQQGWVFIRQRGSHVTLHKNGDAVVIPMHKELKKGLECALRKKLEAAK